VASGFPTENQSMYHALIVVIQEPLLWPRFSRRILKKQFDHQDKNCNVIMASV